MSYFFKTVTERGRNRLRPLSGQFMPDGSPIDPTLNVQSDKEVRVAYPIATVFGSESIFPRAGFYEASQIYPVGLSEGEYISESHIPPKKIKDDYEIFLAGGSTSTSSEKKSPTVDFKKTLKGKLMNNPDYKVPSVSKTGFYVDSDLWYLMLRNISNGVNTMLLGPSGTGKTELVMFVCEKLGVPCRVYDMGSMYDPVAGLLGVHRLMGGKSVFDYAKFAQDIAEPGVVLLDELSRAPVTTNNILFPCLDSRRMLPVEIAGGEDLRSVKVHEECCFVATANVGAEYTGTMSMDRALVSRFFPIELDYMPKAMEEQVLRNRCRIGSLEATQVVRISNKIRNLFKKCELSCSVSTRETLLAGELIADGWTVLQAVQLTFLPLFEGTTSDGERGIVNKLIMEC